MSTIFLVLLILIVTFTNEIIRINYMNVIYIQQIQIGS